MLFFHNFSEEHISASFWWNQTKIKIRNSYKKVRWINFRVGITRGSETPFSLNFFERNIQLFYRWTFIKWGIRSLLARLAILLKEQENAFVIIKVMLWRDNQLKPILKKVFEIENCKFSSEKLRSVFSCLWNWKGAIQKI